MGLTRTIEVDEATAAALERSAAEQGLSVPALVAELAAAAIAFPTDVDELDRRWAAVQEGEPTVPHEEVARWLETWGTPAFKPWRKD